MTAIETKRVQWTPQETGCRHRKQRPPVIVPRGIKLYHLRFFVNGEVSPKGGVTIAIDPFRRVWAASWCSPEDNFCGWRGSLAALGRLRKYGALAWQPLKADRTGVRAYRLPRGETVADVVAHVVQQFAPTAWLQSVNRWLQRRNLAGVVLATKSGSVQLEASPNGEWALFTRRVANEAQHA